MDSMEIHIAQRCHVLIEFGLITILNNVDSSHHIVKMGIPVLLSVIQLTSTIAIAYEDERITVIPW